MTLTVQRQKWFTESSYVCKAFFSTDVENWTSDPDFVVDLRYRICQLRPVPPVWHGEESRRSFVLQELFTATHAFVRVDAHRTPLQAPYTGPYKVLERRSNCFELDLGSREDVVSVDRLKPAFLDEPVRDNQEPGGTVARARQRHTPVYMEVTGPVAVNCDTDLTPVVTRSGRRIQLPRRYR